MPITPELPSNIPLSPSAPKSFEEANRMIQEAWKVAFPSLRFPFKLVGVFPSRKSPLVLAAPHEASDQQRPPASMHQSTNLKAYNLLERSSGMKAGMMTATFDKLDKQANARQRTRGEDMPPPLLGYFPYVPVGRTINMSELGKELRNRNVAFKLTLKVTKKCELLKKDEACRKEEPVDADLTTRGYQFHGLKLARKL
jgi:hypothetical protein